MKACTFCGREARPEHVELCHLLTEFFHQHVEDRSELHTHAAAMRIEKLFGRDAPALRLVRGDP